MITEERYAEKLDTAITGFLEPLQADGYLSEDLHVMLVSCRRIRDVSNGLLGNIHSRIHQRPSLVVSSAFLEYAPKFSCYTPYCARYWSAHCALRKMMRDDEHFRRRVQELSAANNNESLQALLVNPVGRITKYQLFFQDLLSSLHNAHPNRKPLQITLTTLQVCSWIQRAHCVAFCMVVALVSWQ